MKPVLFVFLLTIFITLSACSRLPDSIVEANNQPIATENVINNQLQANPTVTPIVKSSVKPFQTNSKLPLVWVGGVSLHDGTLDSDWIWANENLDNISDHNQAGTVINVDIMNCAGYLGSGNISYKTKTEEDMFTGWRLTITKETIVVNVTEKLKQCDDNTKPDGKYFFSNAFAIAPQNDRRKDIRIEKVNTQELFTSLPKDTQKFLNNKFALDGGREKNILSLRNDNWTDIDGDGKIDLIVYEAMYDVEHSTGVIMLLINGKWKNIGVVRD